MFQARVKADARYPMITAGGGQHFNKRAFLQVVPGTEEEVARHPDLEVEEVLAVEPAPTPAGDDETKGEPPADPAVALEDMTKAELLDRAEAAGAETTTSMTKAQIIAAIQAVEVEK